MSSPVQCLASDGLGSCSTPNTRLTIWFLPHKEHQSIPLYSATHSRYCKNEKNEGVHCFSGHNPCTAAVTLRFPPSRMTAHLWNLSLISNVLESFLLVMEACSQLLKRRQTTSGLPLPKFTELMTARVSSTENVPRFTRIKRPGKIMFHRYICLKGILAETLKSLQLKTSIKKTGSLQVRCPHHPTRSCRVQFKRQLDSCAHKAGRM